MNDYDQAARYAARRLDAEGLLRWTLGAAVFATWRWLGWLDTQAVPFPGEPDRRSDTVAAFLRLAQDGLPVAVVVEFMSAVRSSLPARLAHYLLAVHQDVPFQLDPTVRYDVVGVVLNLTGAEQAQVWEMTPPGFGGLSLRLHFGVRTLREQDAVATMAAVEQGALARCVLACVPLMAGADRAEVVAEWRRLAETEPDPRIRLDLGGLALTFANLAKRQAMWRKGLEDYGVEQSEFVREWVAIGEARGEVRGEARALRAKLTLLLRKRFALPAEDLVALVEAQTDPLVLDRWFDAALSATSLDDVRKAFTPS